MKAWKRVIATGLTGAMLLGCLGLASAATSTTKPINNSKDKKVTSIVKKTEAPKVSTKTKAKKKAKK